jgi:hypothetical protein
LKYINHQQFKKKQTNKHQTMVQRARFTNEEKQLIFVTYKSLGEHRTMQTFNKVREVMVRAGFPSRKRISYEREFRGQKLIEFYKAEREINIMRNKLKTIIDCTGECECNICYKNVTTLRVLRCHSSHIVCEECINQLKNRCPWCRATIDPITI